MRALLSSLRSGTTLERVVPVEAFAGALLGTVLASVAAVLSPIEDSAGTVTGTAVVFGTLGFLFWRRRIWRRR